MKWDQVECWRERWRGVLRVPPPRLLEAAPVSPAPVPACPDERDPLVSSAVRSLCVTRALLRRQPIDATALVLVLRSLDLAEASLLLLDDERQARLAKEPLK